MTNETCVAPFFHSHGKIPIHTYLSIHPCHALFTAVFVVGTMLLSDLENLREPPNLISCTICECNAFCVL